MPEEKPEKEMEELSRAIVAAITGSKKVRQAMKKICEQEKIGGSSYMMMMLELKNLAEYLGLPLDTHPSCEDTDEEESQTEFSDKADNEEERVTESESLSKNEIAFREFLADRFDEASWLSKNRISFER